MSNQFSDTLLFAKDLIKRAGQLILELKRQPLQLEEKKNFSDLVTVVDKETEAFLVKEILKKYPTHGIMGEEGTFIEDISQLDTIWIIDPIDGTTNFVQDIPYYAISIGVIHKGEEWLGLVYNPVTDELFYAEKGKGAYVNGEQLKIEGELTIQETVFSTSMFWQNNRKKDSLHQGVIELYNDSRAIRMAGGAALSLCDVARGRFNAYLMPMLNAWDFAAGKVILQESGGIVTRLNGDSFTMNEKGSLLGSHPDIYKDVVKYINNNS